MYPAAPKESTLLPGRKWLSDFFLFWVYTESAGAAVGGEDDGVVLPRAHGSTNRATLLSNGTGEGTSRTGRVHLPFYASSGSEMATSGDSLCVTHEVSRMFKHY
jgi:hypothetical protein